MSGLEEEMYQYLQMRLVIWNSCEHWSIRLPKEIPASHAFSELPIEAGGGGVYRYARRFPYVENE